MFPQDIKLTIKSHLSKEFDEDRYIYFTQYHSSKSLTEERVQDILEEYIGANPSSVDSLDGDGVKARLSGSPVLFWQLPQERWLIVYSSALNQSTRNKLQKVDKYVGWLLEVWIRSETVDELYRDFSPDDESVNIQRRWDPYYIYQRDSDIPEELEHYYNEHIKEFVEQGIEFNIKTPSWMVDDALNEGVQESLLEKSEISKSKFTFRTEDAGPFASDGGESEGPFEAGVTVQQGGKVVHRSGESEATFELLDELERQNDHFEEFSSIIPEQEYEELENGVKKPVKYKPGGVLFIKFKERDFNEEASLTLSNLLTVGHNDVDLHGIITERDELSFTAKSYTSYDNGEYEIQFREGEFGEAVLEIRPISGSTSGLTYLLHKLQEKFDPRIQYKIVNHDFQQGRAA